MATTSDAATAAEAGGRFYELQRELAPRRRAPYRLTDDIAIPPVTRSQVLALRRTRDDDEQMAIVLGDQHEAIEALFAERPLDEWYAFQRDLYAHLFGQGAAELPGGSQGS
ncbi:hypothetical protein SAMN04244553_4544 [Nocardia amikacinitolerans]|uniref:Tail assembly chaperone n=1 Tax=Nocardia amikacinitolerans TaxID=756689 RepID=A0A285LVA5_9NOCA|nr:hypothetical protein [Nocardia amikacinitolerans]MCP2276451.1 hypothetical protein [Nocardia amikacinitolerans]MCP2295168.1 hypothetical protein [Nocardia amikacinitolerans]SNY87596.1 hypothetical protein SAMN04244553_4544 [Nocardia amikacinitolerans]